MNLISKKDLIFIAGHKGMVGSAIYRKLKQNGYKNIITADRKELDLSSSSNVNKWFKNKKPQIVILAAAKVGGILANSSYPVEFLLENLKIQNNVIESSWQNSVKRLLFLGSSCIYPKFAKQPIEEKSLLTGSLEKTNESYAIAKIAGIKLCEALRTEYGFDAISLMPTNLYGKGDNYHHSNSHVIPALISKFYDAKINNNKKVILWGTGNPKREFLHVDDLASASLFALEKWNPSKNSSNSEEEINDSFFLNVGTGEDISIKELANLVSKTIGFNGSIEWDHSRPDGTPRKLLDISRIKDLGWQPSIKLKEGLKSTVESYVYELNNNLART